MLAFSAGADLHTHKMNEILLTHVVQHVVCVETEMYAYEVRGV